MFQGKMIDALSIDQQAILFFIIQKGMHKVTQPSTSAPPALVVRALVPESEEYKRMISFVRKGGDHPIALPNMVERIYSNFLSV